MSFLTFRTPELLSSSAVPVSTTVIFSLYFGWMDVCFVPYSRTVPYGTRYPELFLIRYVDRGTVLPASAQLAYDLSLQQYEQGVTDFLTVLTVQQTLLEVEDSLVQAQGMCAETLVELYRALGGGWTAGALPELASESKESSS